MRYWFNKLLITALSTGVCCDAQTQVFSVSEKPPSHNTSVMPWGFTGAETLVRLSVSWCWVGSIRGSQRWIKSGNHFCQQELAAVPLTWKRFHVVLTVTWILTLNLGELPHTTFGELSIEFISLTLIGTWLKLYLGFYVVAWNLTQNLVKTQPRFDPELS